MKNSFNYIENKVMEMLLSGDDRILRILREQFQAAEVAKREMSGAGFFTTFAVPPDVPRIEQGKTKFSYGDVSAKIDGLEHGAGFVLHVNNGTINYLEGYTFDENWPPEPFRFELRYSDAGVRNLAALEKNWR